MKNVKNNNKKIKNLIHLEKLDLSLKELSNVKGGGPITVLEPKNPNS